MDCDPFTYVKCGMYMFSVALLVIISPHTWIIMLLCECGDLQNSVFYIRTEDLLCFPENT
jgi:hypothetical protein